MQISLFRFKSKSNFKVETNLNFVNLCVRMCKVIISVASPAGGPSPSAFEPHRTPSFSALFLTNGTAALGQENGGERRLDLG